MCYQFLTQYGNVCMLLQKLNLVYYHCQSDSVMQYTFLCCNKKHPEVKEVNHF